MSGHKDRKKLMNSICQIYKRAKIVRKVSKTQSHNIYNVAPNIETSKSERFFKGAWPLSA